MTDKGRRGGTLMYHPASATGPGAPARVSTKKAALVAAILGGGEQVRVDTRAEWRTQKPLYPSLK